MYGKLETISGKKIEEAANLSALSAAGSFQIESGTLVIQDSAGNPVMQFNKL
jgi:hypothetical protein